MDQEVTLGDAGKTCNHEGGCNCQQEQVERPMEHAEMDFAFLLALTPLVVLTFFGQVGLI